MKNRHAFLFVALQFPQDMVFLLPQINY